MFYVIKVLGPIIEKALLHLLPFFKTF